MRESRPTFIQDVPADHDLAANIRSFIVEHFLFGEARDIDSSASLLDSGILDSTGVMELVAFIEGEYGVSIEDTEMITDNLDSIDNICRFISSKLLELCVSGNTVVPLNS